MSMPISTSAACARGGSEPGLLAFDRAAARRYAEIRRNRSIRPPDAIQLACAALVGVDLFITNDDRLSGLTIPGIQFLVPLDRAFL